MIENLLYLLTLWKFFVHKEKILDFLFILKYCNYYKNHIDSETSKTCSSVSTLLTSCHTFFFLKWGATQRQFLRTSRIFLLYTKKIPSILEGMMLIVSSLKNKPVTAFQTLQTRFMVKEFHHTYFHMSMLHVDGCYMSMVTV